MSPAVYSEECNWKELTPSCYTLAEKETKGATDLEVILFPLRVYNALWVKAELCKRPEFIAQLLSGIEPEGAQTLETKSEYLHSLVMDKNECLMSAIKLLDEKTLEKLIKEEFVTPLLGKQSEYKEKLDSKRGVKEFELFYRLYDKAISNKPLQPTQKPRG